ncbi:EF-hand domain-containing protein [uncultured Xylophilus sp.]|uniref:EF-hand domain-containing protein n=1 Tax=uncultured Xylophilus sp. TaxID=296832 RepID=UPI0025F80D19|nr:EF-hand domain-containing protein [uncultured Xylophilus sp.]
MHLSVFPFSVRPSLLRAAAAVLLACAGGAQAQPATGTPPPPAAANAAAPAPDAPGGPSKGEVLAARQFKWLDANGDGYLTRDEVALFPRLRDAFDQADTDRDNRVSFAEIRALALQRRAERTGAAAADSGAPQAPAPTEAPAPLPAPAAPAPERRW